MIKLLHVLLFVYWLGADAGTYYASRFVADGTLPAAARATAAKIMLGIDMAPRIAMPLTLASGVHVAAGLGLLPLAGGALAAVWLTCLAWLGAVLLLHVRGAGGAPRLLRADFVFRIGLAAVLAVAALAALLAGRPAVPGWLALKVLAFAATVACGLMIRVHLRPFGPAFGRRMRGNGSSSAEAAADDAAIATSIARCKPYVVVIWALLVLCAAAGLHLIG